jgi:hypothetical protein
MLNDVIFTKLHVSAERGHLQVSHLYRGNVEVIMNSVGSSVRDLYFFPLHVWNMRVRLQQDSCIYSYVRFTGLN